MSNVENTESRSFIDHLHYSTGYVIKSFQGYYFNATQIYEPY